MTIATDRRNEALRVLDKKVPIFVKVANAQKAPPEVTVTVTRKFTEKRRFLFVEYDRTVQRSVSLAGWSPYVDEKFYILEDCSVYFALSARRTFAGVAHGEQFDYWIRTTYRDHRIATSTLMQLAKTFTPSN